MMRYRVILLLTSLLFLGLVATFNFWIDPYNLRQAAAPRLALFDSLYLSKPWQLRAAAPELLVVGSSRVGNAFSGDFESWTGKRFYNAGLPAAIISDLDYVVAATQRQQRLQQVVLALDFYMFLDVGGDVATSARQQLWQRLEPADYSLHWWLRAVEDVTIGLLRWRASLDSWHTWRASDALVRGEREGLLLYPDGQWRVTGSSSSEARTAFVGALRMGGRLYCADSFGGRDDLGLDFANAESLLQRLYESGVRTDLVILPMHASLLQMIEACGLQALRGRWKRDLAALNESLAARLGASAFRLWDFSGYNSMTTEPLPEAGYPQRWFIDPSHPSEAAGAAIADTLGGMAGHGRLLTTANVDDAWSAELSAGESYAKQLSPDVAELKSRLQQLRTASD